MGRGGFRRMTGCTSVDQAGGGRRTGAVSREMGDLGDSGGHAKGVPDSALMALLVDDLPVDDLPVVELR